MRKDIGFFEKGIFPYKGNVFKTKEKSKDESEVESGDESEEESEKESQKNYWIHWERIKGHKLWFV